MASSSSSFSSSSGYPWKYDVFLSFRGEDTRSNFVGHLCESLRRKGLRAFIDDKQLERGEDISPALLEGIEQSRLALIVFSENYASSSWCLDELVKILECKEVKGQKVLPVFYKVDPSHVRNLQGSFARAFKKRKRDYAQKMEKVQIWKTALKKAASISGWDTEKTANGHEATCIREITNDISKKLGSPISSFIGEEQDLVGIDFRVEKVCSMLDIGGSNDVRVVGIWGMGGIGKTTLAEVVYHRIGRQFEDRSILKIGEFLKGHSLEALWRKFNSLSSKLCHKRVLVVLDDVDAIAQQLNKILTSYRRVGSRSRIIITSRDAHLLTQLEVRVDTRYEVEALDENEALELLSLKAFKESSPPQDYVDLSHQMLQYAGGLPLALKVLGGSLYRRDLIEWEDALGKLKKIGNNNILEVLKISYDRLDELEKQIFLDLACFFQGYPRDYVTRIFEAFGFSPIIGIKTLIEKSLITVSWGNGFQMHTLIQEMGQHIVRSENREPGRRSRIWNPEDACQALMENTVTDAVEVISLCFPEPKEVNCNPEVFKKMNKLRVLKFHNARISTRAQIEYLSSKLVILDWIEYPSKSLPTSFIPDNLVELWLTYSRITELWKGRQTLGKLRFLDLNGSQNLERTPDFTGLPNLEFLDLSECTTLGEVHPSIAFHKKLIRLYMQKCSNLKSLADNIHLESLEVLDLYGCLKFEKFPEIVGKMEKLSDLCLDRTSIKELPSSIEQLSGLKEISLRGCKKITRLPGKMSNMQTLRIIRAEGSAITQIPSLASLGWVYLSECKGRMARESGLALSCLTNLCGLVRLELRGAHILDGVLPDGLGCLENLQWLDLSETNIEALPKLPSRLGELYANNCTSLTRVVPGVFSRCSESLYYLSFENCFGLVENQEDSFLDTVMQWFCQRVSIGDEHPVRVALPGSEIPKWFTCQGTAVPRISVSCAFCAVYGGAVSLLEEFLAAYGILFCHWSVHSHPEPRGPHLYVVYKPSIGPVIQLPKKKQSRPVIPIPPDQNHFEVKAPMLCNNEGGRSTRAEATTIGYRLV